MTHRAGVVALFLSFALAAGAEDVKVLIVDGQNNHNWAAMTPFMVKQFKKQGGFQVDVATSPGKKNKDKAAWDSFRPEFKEYDVVLSNYNGKMWPEPVQKAFLEFVEGGGGFLSIHAANNSFQGWKEYNKMIGLGWWNKEKFSRLCLDDEGKEVQMKPGEGPKAGHGPQHEFQLMIRNEKHPITKGMPTLWMHTRDELYHGQRGPAADMQILATAYSAKDKRGTGAHEPMLWIIPYGKGKVVTNVMGHENGKALQCVGFLTLMFRSCEWLATGKVTIPVPGTFPTKDKTSSVVK